MESKDLSISTLKTLLAMDPETGLLTWKDRPPQLFASAIQGAYKASRIWNGKWSGKPALNSIDSYGYRSGTIFDRSYRAHRVVFALHHGAWPKKHIDHINGDRADNRPINLREATPAENQRNQTNLRCGNSGHVGVNYHKQTGKWVAKIGVRGAAVNLGIFSDKRDAISARVQAERDYGFSTRHGRRATGGGE